MDEKEQLLKQTCVTIQSLVRFAKELGEEIGMDYTIYKFMNFYLENDVDEFWKSSSARC